MSQNTFTLFGPILSSVNRDGFWSLATVAGKALEPGDGDDSFEFPRRLLLRLFEVVSEGLSLGAIGAGLRSEVDDKFGAFSDDWEVAFVPDTQAPSIPSALHTSGNHVGAIRFTSKRGGGTVFVHAAQHDGLGTSSMRFALTVVTTRELTTVCARITNLTKVGFTADGTFKIDTGTACVQALREAEEPAPA